MAFLIFPIQEESCSAASGGASFSASAKRMRNCADVGVASSAKGLSCTATSKISASFAAAAESADWTSARDFSLVITNAPGAQAWPITATNFILMRKQPRDAAAAKAAQDFFRWAWKDGTGQAKSLDYVPLPADLVQQVEAYWAEQLK